MPAVHHLSELTLVKTYGTSKGRLSRLLQAVFKYDSSTVSLVITVFTDICNWWLKNV